MTIQKVSVLDGRGEKIAVIPESFAYDLIQYGYKLRDADGRSFLIPPSYSEEKVS